MKTGLVGILSGNPADLADIGAMEDRLHALPGASQVRFASRLLVLYCRVAPWVSEGVRAEEADGSIWILLGSAYVGQRRIDAGKLATGYRKEGESYLTALSGTFSVLFWDNASECLTLVMDRLATHKLYMFRQGRLLLFSTELAALLAHPAVPREVDAYALAQFLTCSHLVDEHSMIRGVTVCRPATVTVWSEQGGSDRVYWQPRIGEGADDGLDAWADRMAEVLRSSVASRAHGTGLLLPVTGGLDSRAIAACLPDSARDGLRCCTFGHAHCHDVRYGRRIARALGAEFRFLPLAADFFRSYLPYATSLADGEISIEALPMLCLLDAAEPGTTQLNGYLGDALSGSDHPDLRPLPNDAARFELVWNRLFQRMGFSEAQLRIVMLPEQYAEIKDRVRDYVRRLYDEAEAPNATDNILAIKLQTRQWRYISYMGRVLGGHYRFEAPFLDNDVLDVFLSMPMAHRLDQRAYRRMLVRHAPHLAAVPEMKTHRPVSFADVYGVKKAGRPMHTPGYLPDGLEWRIKRVRHKLGGWVAGLSGGWLGLHNRDYYVHHDESIRRVATNWFRARLLEHPLAGEWFDTRALRTLWDEHLAGKMDHSIRINNVVAFLAWYENIRS